MQDKKEIIGLGILGLCLIAAGCSLLLFISRNRNEQGESQKKVGAVYMTMNNPYFEVIDEEIKAVVKSRGDVMITRDAALDSEMQNRQIRELIGQGVDILLVNAIDWKKIGEGLQAAKEEGIPVIAVDTEIYEDEYVVGTVCSDNYNAGVLCAEDLMRRRESGSILFMIQGNNKSAIDRIQGFKDTLDAAEWPYQTVAELDCQGQLEIAQPMVEETLKTCGEINVVMGLNDPSSLGAMAALDAAGLLSDILVYSVDGSPEAKTMVYEGRMTATAAQSPLSTGSEVADMLYKVLDGKTISSKAVIPVELITSKNIDAYSLTGWQ